MTQDEIIEMARFAGFKMENSAALQAAKAFYKLVAAKEREACAQVAFSWNIEITDKVAEEIRARGEQA
jgi:hypothetical protein